MLLSNSYGMFSVQITLASIYLINFIFSTASAAATLYVQQKSNNLLAKDKVNVCTSSLCQREASYFLNIMNETVNPCDDFYQFVCGKFISNTKIKIPIGKEKLRVFGDAQDTINNRLLRELQEIKEDDTDSFRKLKIFYANCKKSAGQESIDDFMEIINNAGGMPLLSGNKWNEKSFNYTDVVFNFKIDGFSVGFPVKISVVADKKNTTKNILKLYYPENGIKKNFFVPDRKKLDNYYKTMINIMVKLGADKELAEKEMKDCLGFEVELYNITSPVEYLRNNTYNPMTLKELSQLVPTIPWMQHFNRTFSLNNITLDEDEVVIVYDPAALQKLGQLLARTPKKVIANYLMWQFIRGAFDFLPDKFTGKKPGDKSSTCLETIKSAIPVAVGALYAQKFLSAGVKKEATELVNYIKNYFKKVLLEVDWIDEKTKKANLDKIEVMDFSIGYPDEYLNNQIIDDYYQNFKINTGSYLRSGLNVTKFNVNNSEKTLSESRKKNDWRFHEDTIINAYYIPSENSLVLPSAILQQPFFHPKKPKYLNYGNLGRTIGHEITHGFDNRGHKYDKNGRLVNWWEPSAEKQFDKKAQCYVSQYSNYTVKEVGLQINGEQTLGENIADSGGVKLAYFAYNDWVNRNNVVEPQLPGLNYTPKQMFWISMASFFCEKHTQKYVKNEIMTNSHSPHEARVMIPLSNIQEFAEDFQCVPGTKMNPENKCTFW